MADFDASANNYSAITQIIGVAYTYRPSLAVRRHLTRQTPAFHSSKSGQFSYFYKGDKYSVVGHRRALTLRSDLGSRRLARHWPEPELAVLLGNRHEIVAYTLANDLTAISIETRGRTEESDGTFDGKVWPGSGSLGPRFVPASTIDDPTKLVVGLRITRRGRTIYDQSYNTSRHLRTFSEIPSAIVECYKLFGNFLPPSKQIVITPDGFLPSGTVVMLGTGLIVKQEYWCEPGDRVTVYCANIGELTNTITTAQETHFVGT